MLKLEQIDKKLKRAEEDREERKREVRYNKNENLDNYFTLAGAFEEKIPQMAERIETTDKERERFIKMNMEETKNGMKL